MFSSYQFSPNYSLEQIRMFTGLFHIVTVVSITLFLFYCNYYLPHHTFQTLPICCVFFVLSTIYLYLSWTFVMAYHTHLFDCFLLPPQVTMYWLPLRWPLRTYNTSLYSGCELWFFSMNFLSCAFFTCLGWHLLPLLSLHSPHNQTRAPDQHPCRLVHHRCSLLPSSNT